MNSFVQKFSRTHSALIKGVLLSASVCAAGFYTGRAYRFAHLTKAAARPTIAVAPIHTPAPQIAHVEKAPSLLASASDVMPFVGTTEASIPPTPKKVRHHKKAAVAKKVVVVKPANSEYDSEEPSWVDAGLLAEEQTSSEDSDQAEDIYDATDVALQTSLIEPDLADDVTSPASVPWQFDQSLIANREIAAERVYGEIAGTYKQNDFSEIRGQLSTLALDIDSLTAVEPSPESKLLAMEKAESELAARKEDAKPTPAPEVISGTFVTSASSLPTAPVSATAAPKVFVDPTISEAELKPVPVKPVAEPTLPPQKEEIVEAPAPKKENVLAPVTAAADSSVPTLVSSTGAAIAGATSILKTAAKSVAEPTLVLPTHAAAPVTTQATAPAKPVAPVTQPTLVKPSGQTAAAATTTTTEHPAMTVAENPRVARRTEIFGPANNADERQIDEKLFGEVLVDGRLSKWLVENKAHIELNLHPVSSRDPQDTVYIDYQYPAADFSLDSREMRGAYRLLADIYTSNAKAPYAQVIYPKAISADTAKEKVLFRLSMREVEQNKLGSPQRNRAISFSSTIFEGASGDYRDPKAISRGSVDVIGFPELGHIPTEADGTFRLPQVPGSSELLLHVQADGYYPSFKVIPTFATDVYAPVYLLARDKVDVITRYFTHHLQSDGNGLLMGRVFDPKTRTPIADEQLQLTYRRGPAVYFSALGALPIIPSVERMNDALATTVNGMFAFFNLKPSMRAVSRSSGKASLLVNVHGQSAEYVEFGRGGVRSLRGQILDQRNPVPARVRLVGDKNIQVDTDPQGNFTLADLDLPPGVLTLEVEAHGYPMTWYTVSWNPREPEGVKRFYLLDKNAVYGGAASTAHVQVDSRQGVLIGQNSIFPKHAACVYVSLFDTAGHLVDGAQGPFSVTDAPKEDMPGLCLTRQKPWFSYFNLPAGEYVLKLTDQNSRTVRSHVVRVGTDRLAISAN